ncbi:hypothetical protein ACFCWT_35095 [Streptomyces olivaceus]|uniref:hypothetical protein n=1 Tax=Streptomyces olivaceus TaxID=47716 RepID=UPI0035E2388B
MFSELDQKISPGSGRACTTEAMRYRAALERVTVAPVSSPGLRDRFAGRCGHQIDGKGNRSEPEPWPVSRVVIRQTRCRLISGAATPDLSA